MAEATPPPQLLPQDAGFSCNGLTLILCTMRKGRADFNTRFASDMTASPRTWCNDIGNFIVEEYVRAGEGQAYRYLVKSNEQFGNTSVRLTHQNLLLRKLWLKPYSLTSSHFQLSLSLSLFSKGMPREIISAV